MKKLISMLLVLCMVLGMSVSVFAESDTWDGNADISWYNNTDTEFVLSTGAQLAGLAKLVDDGNTFEGKTVMLGNDIDLESEPFNPIGHSANGKSFNGTFDGQGHTISNLNEQSNLDSNNGGWLYEGEYYGLFAYTNCATIKNVTIDGAYISSGRNEAAGVVGNAVDTAFSNIKISNTTLIAYNNSAGGVAAECYGECSFTNIVVDKDTVIGPLWGTYDVRLGGVVGLVQAGNKVTMKNVAVSCKLDAINDVAANYQYWLYRYSGMLIGQVDGVDGVADPTGYVTCENVTVTYGDWVNYHYCEFESLGAGSYNGPGEYKYARVEAGTGTGGIDISTCQHDEDESHNVLIVFDQLFGGGQGVSGLKTYAGVNVNYPSDEEDTTPSTPVLPPVVEDTTDDDWDYEEEEIDTHTSKSDMEELIDDLSKNDTSVTIELLSDDDTIGYSALKLAAEEGLSVELDGTDDGYFWRFALGEDALEGFKGSFKSYVDIDAGLSTSLKKILKDSNNYQIFKTEHEGKVPDTTTLGVKLEKELCSADELYLYYWNSEKKQVEEMDVTMYREGNYLCMEIPHYSTYIVTNEPIEGAVVAEQGAAVTSPVVSVDKANPETGASDFVGAAVALAVVSAAGMAALNFKK